MTRPTLGAALLLGALFATPAATSALAADPAPAPEQTAAGCTEGLDRLGRQVSALEAAGPGSAAPATAAPVTPQEIAQLRTLLQAGQTMAQAGNAPACQAILTQAQALSEAVAHPRAVAAAQLEKAKLRGGDGADLGNISGLVIDPTTGRVAYAVVELGGFLGLGESHFPVPWGLFVPSGDGYVLNVPKERLTNAPRFNGSSPPDMNDRQWAMAVHTYYGVPPYWMRDSAALAAATSGDSAAPLRQETQRLSQEVARLNRELAEARAAAGSSADPAAGSTAPAAPAAPAEAAPQSGAGNSAPQPPVSNQ